MAAELAFADPLYEMQNAVCAVLREYGFETKRKYGSLLQFLGTEFGRTEFGPDIWVNIAKHRMERLERNCFNYHGQRGVFIISDCRFENELNAFPGAIKVRLECAEEIRKSRILTTPGQNWCENTNHPSETGLDHITDWSGKFDTGRESTESIGEWVFSVIQRCL